MGDPQPFLDSYQEQVPTALRLVAGSASLSHLLSNPSHMSILPYRSLFVTSLTQAGCIPSLFLGLYGLWVVVQSTLCSMGFNVT